MRELNPLPLWALLFFLGPATIQGFAGAVQYFGNPSIGELLSRAPLEAFAFLLQPLIYRIDYMFISGPGPVVTMIGNVIPPATLICLYVGFARWSMWWVGSAAALWIGFALYLEWIL